MAFYNPCHYLDKMAKLYKAVCFLGVVSLVAVVSLVVIASLALFYRSRPALAIPVSSAGALAETTDGVPCVGPGNREKRTEEAYVTLLYTGSGFFSAVRVLGQSLRESGTTRDYVVLCMDDVEQWAKDVLAKDGWRVRSVGRETCVGSTAAFNRHITKIQAWLLTEYRRVIYVDADAVVLHNIDHLFKCANYCASYRHSDLFNAGVSVLKPSVDTFRSMCRYIQSIGSYSGGDQVFLNHYYEQMKYASMFSKDKTAVQGAKFLRLPSEYNSDVSVYYLQERWMYIDVDEPYVLHYTLGPVKPWKWWTYPLFSLHWKWKSLRDRLPPADVREPSLWDWQSWLPLPLLIALYLSSRMWCGWYSRVINCSPLREWVQYLICIRGNFSKFFPTLVLLLACYFAYFHVPIAMSPLEAWTRYGMWILLFFLVPYCAYCHLVYMMGKRETNNSTLASCQRLTAEGILWLMLTTLIFYMQFLVPAVLCGIKLKMILFLSLAACNFVLCYFYGQRLIHFSFKLGSLTSNSHQ